MHFAFIASLFVAYYLLGGDKGINNISIRRWQVFVMGTFMFLFAALRAYTVGYDVEYYYYQMYLSGEGNTISEWYKSHLFRDPGFYFLIGVLHQISSDPQIMLVVVGASVAFGFSYFVYHEKGNALLFYLMFIGFRLFPFTLSGLRQAMAMSFIFVAFIQLKQNRTLVFLILTLIASTFHISSFVFLLAFPITRFKNSAVLLIGSLLIIFLNLVSDGAIADTVASLLYNDRFEGYIVRSQEMAFEGSFTLYVYLIIYAISFLFYFQLKHNNKLFYQDFNILTIGIFFAFIGQSMDNVFRIAYYFIYPLYPIFSQLLFVLFKDRKTVVLVGGIVSILLAVQYLILGPGAGTGMYKFFWEVAF